MRSGEMLGAEALIRWRHPENGLLMPSAFLPLIENHPLAIELGEWVIEAALSQIERWQAAGLQVPISVNVGAYQLEQPDFGIARPMPADAIPGWLAQWQATQGGT